MHQKMQCSQTSLANQSEECFLYLFQTLFLFFLVMPPVSVISAYLQRHPAKFKRYILGIAAELLKLHSIPLIVSVFLILFTSVLIHHFFIHFCKPFIFYFRITFFVVLALTAPSADAAQERVTVSVSGSLESDVVLASRFGLVAVQL